VLKSSNDGEGVQPKAKNQKHILTISPKTSPRKTYLSKTIEPERWDEAGEQMDETTDPERRDEACKQTE
jgi:hypothetical protein